MAVGRDWLSHIPRVATETIQKRGPGGHRYHHRQRLGCSRHRDVSSASPPVDEFLPLLRNLHIPKPWHGPGHAGDGNDGELLALRVGPCHDWYFRPREV